MKKLLIILTGIVLVLASCKRELELDVPKPPSQLVVYGAWQREQPLTVYVAKTRNLGDSSLPEFFYDPSRPNLTEEEQYRRFFSIGNAEVTVYKNNVFYDRLAYDAEKYLYKSTSGKLAVYGSEYSVKVTAPGFAEVASPVVPFPEAVHINSVTTQKNVAADDYASGRLDEVTIEFDDVSTAKDWYRVRVLETSQPEDRPSYIAIYPKDIDVVVTPTIELLEGSPFVYSDQIILSDEHFNGKTKKLVLRFSSWNFRAGDNIGGKVVVEHITEDQFKYIKSQILNTENPFSTPVPRYTNIKNGQGLFSLYSSEQKEMN
jgi:hypothetical protein